MSNLQLQLRELRVWIENPSVNEMNCYLFPEALPAWPLGRPHYIGEVNQKRTPGSTLVPLVELLVFELSKQNLPIRVCSSFTLA